MTYLHLKQQTASIACTGVSLGFLLFAPVSKTPIPFVSASFATALLARVLDNKELLDDETQAEAFQRQKTIVTFHSQGKLAKVLPDTPDTQSAFDLTSIGDDRNSFPNVFILGAPGSGKTSIAEYLGCLLKANHRYAIHPHAKPTDFRGFDGIFGGGRNIGTPEDTEVSWTDIESKRVVPSVAQVIRAIHNLMQTRYQSYYQGRTEFPTIDFYIDELPAISSELGKKYLSQYLPSLIMECRKVGIRLWFLSQAFQVKALGLQDMSDLREGATIIRLGKLAVREAETLARNGRVDRSVVEQLKETSRPVLVDDMVAKLPGWTEMRAVIDVFSKSKPESVQIQSEPTDHGLGSQLMSAFDHPNTPELTRNIIRKLQPEALPVALKLVYKLAKAQGISHSVILRSYWGYQGNSERVREGQEMARVLGLE